MNDQGKDQMKKNMLADTGISLPDHRADLCKTCIKTDVCMLDKNVCGDVYVAPSPWFFDEEYRKKAWENYKKRKAEDFPCEHYVNADMEANVTQEIVSEWCKKRCLSIVDNRLLQKYANERFVKNSTWIDRGSDHIMRWVCRVCGKKYRNNSNYCPECGAFFSLYEERAGNDGTGGAEEDVE